MVAHRCGDGEADGSESRDEGKADLGKTSTLLPECPTTVTTEGRAPVATLSTDGLGLDARRAVWERVGTARTPTFAAYLSHPRSQPEQHSCWSRRASDAGRGFRVLSILGKGRAHGALAALLDATGKGRAVSDSPTARDRLVAGSCGVDRMRSIHGALLRRFLRRGRVRRGRWGRRQHRRSLQRHGLRLRLRGHDLRPGQLRRLRPRMWHWPPVQRGTVCGQLLGGPVTLR
jgi:hypothetical protein